MANVNTIAEAFVKVNLDFGDIQNQLKTASKKIQSAMSSIATNQNKANTANAISLREELKNRREILRVERERVRVLSRISQTSFKVGLGAVGAVGYGLKEYLKSTDMGAKILQGSLLKVKASAYQLFSNIGKQANVKFGISEKLEKLSKFMDGISKADINKFLDNAKMAIFIAGFTKILLTIKQMADFFEKIKNANMAKNALNQTSGLNNASGNVAGSALGSALGLRGLGKTSAYTDKMTAYKQAKEAQRTAQGMLVGDPNYKVLEQMKRDGSAFTKTGRPSVKFKKEASKLKQQVWDSVISSDMLKEAKANYKALPLGTRVAGNISAPFKAARSGISKMALGAEAGVGAGMAGAGAGLAAMLALGAAASALGKDGLEPAAKAADGLNKATAWLSRAFFTAIEVVKIFTNNLADMLSPIISLITAIFDLFTWNLDAFKADMQSFKDNAADYLSGDSTVRRLKEFKENFDAIWDEPKGAKDKMDLAGKSSSGGFADLNKMFQQMFEENVMKGLTNATQENTVATKECTKALMSLANYSTMTEKEKKAYTSSYNEAYKKEINSGASTSNSLSSAQMQQQIQMPIENSVFKTSGMGGQLIPTKMPTL